MPESQLFIEGGLEKDNLDPVFVSHVCFANHVSPPASNAERKGVSENPFLSALLAGGDVFACDSGRKAARKLAEGWRKHPTETWDTAEAGGSWRKAAEA